MKYKGTTVFNPHHPRNMLRGGRINVANRMTPRQVHNDSTLIMAMPGEVVLPVKYYHKASKRPIRLADRVLAELRKQGIKLPK